MNNDQAANKSQWLVVYTKSRQEKKVAEELLKLGIEAYCPVKKVLRQWSDRKKIVETPLFTSYCFVKVAEADRHRVLQTKGVVCFLFWCKQAAVIKEKEIEEIKRWLNDYDHDHIHVEDIQVNEKVMIGSGNFMDQIAIVKKYKGNQLILDLPSLGFRVLVKKEDIILTKVA